MELSFKGSHVKTKNQTYTKSFSFRLETFQCNPTNYTHVWAVLVFAQTSGVYLSSAELERLSVNASLIIITEATKSLYDLGLLAASIRVRINPSTHATANTLRWSVS